MNYNRSWPLWAATSAAAGAVEERDVDVVDLDFDVVLLAPLLCVRPVERGSYAGTKWAHCKILSSPASCLSLNFSGPVQPQRLVREAAEHADGECGSCPPFQQILLVRAEFCAFELLGASATVPSFREDSLPNGSPVKPLMKRSRNAL